MIRPFTLLMALLAAGAGAYLFAVKHRAQLLDNQLAAVTQQSREDGQRIRVLQAQWALEIDPTRLNQLATQFTSLQPMKPAQLVTLSGLAHDLPAAGAPAPGQGLDGTLQGLPDPGTYSTVIAANGLPLPPPMMPPADEDAPTELASAAAAPPVAAASPAPAPTVVVAQSVAPARPVTPAAAGPVLAMTTPPAALAPAHPARLAAPHRTPHQPPAAIRLAQVVPTPVYGAEHAETPVSAIYGGYRPYTPPPPPPRPYGVQPTGGQAVGAQMVPAKASPSPAGSMLGMAADSLPPPQPFDGTEN